MLDNNQEIVTPRRSLSPVPAGSSFCRRYQHFGEDSGSRVGRTRRVSFTMGGGPTRRTDWGIVKCDQWTQ